MDDAAVIDAKNGYHLCDSSACRAVAYRRIGSLPLSTATGCCDIGEAKLTDGRRVMITIGRNVTPDEQFWYAHNSTFANVWLGAEDGACELILGETFGQGATEDWLWLGMRIVQEEGVDWKNVEVR